MSCSRSTAAGSPSETGSIVKTGTPACYAAPQDGHLFLKPAVPPAYLHCAKAPSCTTIEYKSGARKHISSEGYKIVADSLRVCNRAPLAVSCLRRSGA